MRNPEGTLCLGGRGCGGLQGAEAGCGLEEAMLAVKGSGGRMVPRACVCVSPARPQRAAPPVFSRFSCLPLRGGR